MIALGLTPPLGRTVHPTERRGHSKGVSITGYPPGLHRRRVR